jgi:hypothetical protein
VREPGAIGKASHRGHRGHGGGWGWWTKFLLRRGGLGARTKRNWESIAQRSRRSRRGIGLVDDLGNCRCGDHVGKLAASAEQVRQSNAETQHPDGKIEFPVEHIPPISPAWKKRIGKAQGCEREMRRHNSTSRIATFDRIARRSDSRTDPRSSGSFHPRQGACYRNRLQNCECLREQIDLLLLA